MKRSCDDLEELQVNAQQRVSWRNQTKKRILSNALPAKEVHADIESATRAGASGCEDFLSKDGKNAARSFKNKLVKSSDWPGLYWADIPMGDPKTGKKVFKKNVFPSAA